MFPAFGDGLAAGSIASCNGRAKRVCAFVAAANTRTQRAVLFNGTMDDRTADRHAGFPEIPHNAIANTGVL